MGIVLFDGKCPWCVSLAHWSQHRMADEARFISFQEYCLGQSQQEVKRVCSEQGGTLETLLVLDQDQVLKGHDAWRWLLKRHPSLRELSWLAAKLGLESQIARQLNGGGQWIRRLCRSCPPRPF